jgi:acyl transferase domain-containing protein/NAD(P)-dependent dehydrogenase (short-subunit alcohol dehydrogenase family)
MEPIAVVGMSCRFPQAPSLDAFWQLLRNGVDAIREVPPDRWDLAEFYDADPAKPGKMYSRWGGFLEKVDEFDAQFFGISPREAVYMDPQQRVLLEVAWEALEDAGAVQNQIAGTKAGVFVGISTYDYAGLHLSDPRLIADGYANTGGALSIAANRISYAFDLRGPSMAVDTACSSSLAAAHIACQSLWSGESSLALAGGVNVILSPSTSIGFSKLRAMSPDGHCKAFDSRADGYVRGEGAAVVVLKPLARALADGDRIYALIRGSAMNQDGRTNGLTAPNGLSQEALVRQALASAGIAPARVGYVEAHGTGTALGDPIEMNALGAALADGRPTGLRCAVGSVKTNIGHLEAAAGVAGLVKVALALQHREIPASLHFLAPNPHIPFDVLPLRVQQQRGPWPEELRPAVAGVSSFGFGGTNVHLVLEEPPSVPAPDGRMAEPDRPGSYVVPLSARNPEALQALARSYSDFLKGPADSVATAAAGPDTSLRDLAYTASVRRTHHEQRLAVVARSRQELREHLDAFVAGESRPGLSSGRAVHGRRRKLVFVFPGQGGQWLGMGRGLLEQEPVFRAALEQCERAIRPYVDWSLLGELHADAARSRLDAIDVIHPALWAMQVGLAALWRSWGVEPDAVVGHSMGEIAGAHVAGALTLDDAARVICRRSALLRRESGRGAMAGVELSVEEVERALAGYEDRVSIAVSNSPTFTVLSGAPGAVAEILASLQARDVFCRPIKGVDVASHSFHMDHLRPELLRLLNGIQPRTPAVPVYSTVAGAARDGLAFDAEYWARNLREPVLFGRAVERMVADGYSVFVEVSPHPILLSAVQQGLQHLGKPGTLIPSIRREEDERTVMLAGLGTLFGLGTPVEWSALHPSGGRPERLPSYAWQRERFWLEMPRPRERAPSSGHPHLRHHVESAAQGTHFWDVDLDVDAFPYLADHRLQGAIVLPAATYVETALAAAREVFGPGATLEQVEFQKPLVLPEKGTQNAQLILSPAMPGTATFQFFAVPTASAGPTASPVLHAAGTIRLGGPVSEGAPADTLSPAQIQARCTESAGVAEHYADARKRGMQYGATFQAIEQIRRRDGEAIATLRVPEDLRSEAASYRVHPALLDNCFQILAAAFPARERADGPADAYVPIGLASLRMDGQLDPAEGLFGHAVLEEGSATAGTVVGDVFLLAETGRVTVAARGLRLRRLEARGEGAAALARDEWFQELRWISSARTAPAPARTDPETAGAWLVFTDSAGVGESLRLLLAASGDACIAVSRGDSYLSSGPNRYVIDPRRPDHYEQLVQDVFGGGLPPRGVVHLWSLDAAPPDQTTLDTLDAACDLGSGSVLHVVQALAATPWREKPRLWLVTRDAQPVSSRNGTDPLAFAQSPLWGLARTIAQEHPELRCVSVDLGAARPEDAAALLEEIRADDREPQVALRGEERYVARLAHCSPEILDRDDTSGHDDVVAAAGQPFRLRRSATGTLEGLRLGAITRAKPGRGEVEIEVAVAGLNFPDVLLALGVLPPLPDGSSPLGLECAGRITALGEGVEGLAVGDEVVALATSSLSSHVIAHAGFVQPRPPQLSPKQAATIPAVFLTAYYSLNHLARLARGERVLIHSASGGVGLAAVQLARSIGAEVFVTAGSEEKRAYLRSLGLERVADSRSLAFADQVKEWTGGEGVDVVLNSLPGEALARGLSLLRPGGRFIELGKRDILRNSPLAMELFKNNRSFFAVDVLGLCRERPELSASILAEFWRYFAAHGLEALPHRVFAASEAEAAFRFMAQAKHIGKVLVAMRDEQAKVVAARESPGIRAEATYLVTGGLGGLGLAVAQWLVAQGARHLVLLGRSAPASAAQAVLGGLEQAGARVVVTRADVSDSRQLGAVLADAARELPPLRGVVHAAGRLDDGILLQLDAARLASVMAPKVAGAWNLHLLTRGQPLDFFILFSSAAAVLGSPGQGNYAAANAFLDALAHYRRSQGLPALSINWGPWSEVGLAVRPDRGGRLASFGMDSLNPREGLAALARLRGGRAAQVSVMPVSPDGWRQLSSAMGNPPVLTGLVEEAGTGATEASPRGRKLSAAMVLSAPAAERQAILEAHLRGEVARVLGLSAARVDVHRPLNTMGIDSLMAVELKNRVEADLGVMLPLIRLIQGPSVAELAALLVEQLGGGESGAPGPSLAPVPPPVRARSDSLLLSLLSLAEADRGA